MGYTTDFEGSLNIKRPLTPHQIAYINLISETRRMKRDVNKLMELYKGKYGNPFVKGKTAEDIYGFQGEFFAREDGEAGQYHDKSILDYNSPAGHSGFAQGEVENGQPGLWCQWEISEDGMELEWNGAEKFYNYTAWLKYLIKMFFIPWGRKLNGEINWSGEETSDIGKIVVKNNVIKTMTGRIEYEEQQ